MSVADIYSDDDCITIQQAFNAATEQVRVHNNPRPRPPGSHKKKPPGIKDETIRVINKGTAGKPFKIVGIDSHDKEVAELGDDMPVIQGSSSGCRPQQESQDCGIFYIGPGCFVEIRGLRLQHTIPDPNDPNAEMHGSCTISHVADNEIPSGLTVTDCDIETNATMAISLRSDLQPKHKTKPGLPTKGHKVPTHNIAIRGCRVTGKPNGGHLGGNYSSVNLGSGGAVPFNMAKSTFEVSGCILDSLVLGVAAWHATGDADSMFLVAGNTMGMGQPTAAGLAFGVSFLSGPSEASVALPKGTIAILGNTINLRGYFQAQVDVPNDVWLRPGVAGVLVNVDRDPLVKGPQLRTVISSNVISMALPKPDNNVEPSAYDYLDGIVYEYDPTLAQKIASGSEPDGDADLNQSVTAYIHDNEVSLAVPPGDTLPRRGIYVGPYAHLVRVTDNQLDRLTVSEAHIEVNASASRNVFVGNIFGKLSGEGVAAVLCDGFQNSFCENDFSESEIPGWQTGAAVCVKLGGPSYRNLVVLEHRNVPTGPNGTDPDHQWLDESTHVGSADEKNVVVVIPYYEGPPSLVWGWPVDLYEAFKEFQFKTRHVWPPPKPGPPVAHKRVA